jgi:hypothetical protein
MPFASGHQQQGRLNVPKLSVCQSTGQAFHAYRGATAEIIALAVGEFDAFDRAVTAFEVNGVRLRAASNNALHVEFVRVTIRIDDGKATHLYIVATRSHSNRAETSFAPANPDGVTVSTAKGDLLAPKLNPVLSAIPVTPLRHSFGNKNCSTHQRGNGRATEFKTHG